VGADLLEVAQLLQVHNSGEATFIGSNADANRVTRVRVPDGAFNFRGAGQEQGDQVFVGEGDSFFHTQPIVPGRSQIAFTFQVALSEFSGTFEHFAPFDTESLEFYLQPASIELDDPFRDLGPVTLHDQTYRRYHIDGLPRSGTIDVVLPVSGSIRWALKWVSLGLMLFASVAAFGLSGRAGAEAHHATTAVGSLADTAGIDPGADSQELEQLRGNLLERLAHMDTAGHHPEHGETRKQLTDRAVAVYQLLALKRGGA